MKELLARIDSRELSEWVAFEREFGPLGLERGDWQAALVAQVTGGNDKTTIKDFLLSWTRRRRQSGKEQLAIFQAMAGEGGGDTE